MPGARGTVWRKCRECNRIATNKRRGITTPKPRITARRKALLMEALLSS